MEFAAGDYVKFEIKDEKSGQSEWFWALLERRTAGLRYYSSS